MDSSTTSESTSQKRFPWAGVAVLALGVAVTVLGVRVFSLRAALLAHQTQIQRLQGELEARRVRSAASERVQSLPTAGERGIATVAMPAGTSRDRERKEASAIVAETPTDGLRDGTEIERHRTVLQAGKVARTYGPFFRRAALGPDQVKKLSEFLVESGMTVNDVADSLQKQGIDLNQPAGRATLNGMMARFQGEADEKLQALVGAETYHALKRYEQSQPERDAVNALAARLHLIAEPLQPAQAEAIVEVMTAARPAGRTLLMESGGTMTTVFTAEILAKAGAVLSEAQRREMVQLRDEQFARLEIAKLRKRAAAPAVGEGGK